MAEKHNEAKVIAFSEIHYEGMKWSFTLREGVTQKQITAMLKRIKFTAEAAVEAGFRVPGSPSGKSKPETGLASRAAAASESVAGGSPAPEPAEEVAKGWNADDNPLHVAKFKVTGTEENPVVELYSVNTKLKFPVLRVPFSVLNAVVLQKYDVDLSALSVCGKSGAVDWQVTWKPSEKNPKWKDLVKVEIPKLTPEKG